MADDPELASAAGRLGALVALRQIGVHHVEFDLHDPGRSGPFRVDGDLAAKWTWSPPFLVYDVSYELTCVEQHDEGDALFLGAKVGVFVRYEVPDDVPEPLTSELEAFGQISAVFAAWPYVREAVQSLTAKAGVPVLTLDVLRRPVSPPDS